MRDRTIHARRNHVSYGMGLGILLLDDIYPGLPGDVRNASGYRFPIQYEIVEQVDIQALCYSGDNTACLEPVLKAAKRLERMGCRAIAAECGYFACFQQQVAAALDIPVFMSSLLQVPLAQRLISPHKHVAIVTSDAHVLTRAHLDPMGIVPGSNYKIVDLNLLRPDSAFKTLWSGAHGTPPDPHLDVALAESQIVADLGAYARDNPDCGALVLECTGYPPFARAIQQAVDLPVFSWGTLLDFAYGISAHRAYDGHV